jgi:hypothetical protein
MLGMPLYCYECARRGTVGSCRARRENPVRGVAHRPPGKPHSGACSPQAQLTLTLATHVTGSSCDTTLPSKQAPLCSRSSECLNAQKRCFRSIPSKTPFPLKSSKSSACAVSARAYTAQRCPGPAPRAPPRAGVDWAVSQCLLLVTVFF